MEEQRWQKDEQDQVGRQRHLRNAGHEANDAPAEDEEDRIGQPAGLRDGAEARDAGQQEHDDEPDLVYRHAVCLRRSVNAVRWRLPDSRPRSN